ncbi:MAG: glycoside hydrolase family 15 protein, partial [Candidatus Woesearchaeota archaeon]
MNASQVNGELLTKSIALIKSAQYPSGLFPASPKGVSTGYNLAWIRDNVYAALGLASTNEKKAAINAIRALLAILKKHEYKIDWIIKQPEPKHSYRYIHARYDPLTGNEIWEPWGNKQNDAIGALLFNIGRLERTGIKVIRNEADIRVLQKLVNYLEAIQYWHDADNGMWEENEELHASSV